MSVSFADAARLPAGQTASPDSRWPGPGVRSSRDAGLLLGGVAGTLGMLIGMHESHDVRSLGRAAAILGAWTLGLGVGSGLVGAAVYSWGQAHAAPGYGQQR